MGGETKERILETALELFAQSGYLGTSMSDIAARLGITKAALYKHYAGKQEVRTLTPQQYRWLMEGLKTEQPKANKAVSGLSAI